LKITLEGMGYKALVDWDGTLSRQVVGATEANRD